MNDHEARAQNSSLKEMREEIAKATVPTTFQHLYTVIHGSLCVARVILPCAALLSCITFRSVSGKSPAQGKQRRKNV